MRVVSPGGWLKVVSHGHGDDQIRYHGGHA